MTNFGVYYRGKKQIKQKMEESNVNEDPRKQPLPNEIITSDDLAIYASYINLLSSVVDLASLYLAKEEDLYALQEKLENDSSSPNAAVT